MDIMGRNLRGEIARSEARRSAKEGKHVFIPVSSREQAEQYRDLFFPNWFIIESSNLGSAEALSSTTGKTYGISNVKPLSSTSEKDD